MKKTTKNNKILDSVVTAICVPAIIFFLVAIYKGHQSQEAFKRVAQAYTNDFKLKGDGRVALKQAHKEAGLPQRC